MKVSICSVSALNLGPLFLIFREEERPYESREATEQSCEDRHYSRFIDCGRDFGAPLYALSALIVSVMLILHI
jgi:hypothetical protein